MLPGGRGARAMSALIQACSSFCPSFFDPNLILLFATTFISTPSAFKSVYHSQYFDSTLTLICLKSAMGKEGCTKMDLTQNQFEKINISPFSECLQIMRMAFDVITTRQSKSLPDDS